MRLSYFFEDMAKAYQAELEDLQSDSEGKNVLAARLKEKHRQFNDLLPMIDVAPEMVAVAFHRTMKFVNPQVIALLSSTEPDEFPSWDDIAHAVQFEPAGQKLADIALRERGGERFLLTSVCLEYLHGVSIGMQHASEEADDRDDGGDEDDDNHASDLEEAGADWLEEQGFDRRG
jgi:hypothetical protein